MQQEKTNFLIITGMSGAGKTQVLRTLEDLNFFCVDNLPPALMPKFAELCRQTPGRDTALVVDTRGGIFFDKLVEVLDEMKAMGQDYEVLFLDATDAVLIRRYKETRRRHPMETLADRPSRNGRPRPMSTTRPVGSGCRTARPPARWPRPVRAPRSTW